MALLRCTSCFLSGLGYPVAGSSAAFPRPFFSKTYPGKALGRGSCGTSPGCHRRIWNIVQEMPLSSSSQTWQDIRVTSSLHPQKNCCRAPQFILNEGSLCMCALFLQMFGK